MFTDSGADALRAALSLAGRADEVVSLPDDFSLGPIAAFESRIAWFEREIGSAREKVGSAECGFWSAALDASRRRTAWWSWRAAREYCGFLEFAWRVRNEPCDALDLSDAAVARMGKDGAPVSVRSAKALALLSPEQIVENGLLDRAEPLTAERRAALRGRWSRLREEDASLRVPMGGGQIVSAPLSFFDDALLRATPDDWRPTARTVAEVLGISWDTHFYQAGDLLLAARVHALAAAGRIELRGGDPRQGMAGTEIRAAERPATP